MKNIGIILVLLLLVKAVLGQDYLAESKVFFDVVKAKNFSAADKSIKMFSQADQEKLKAQLNTEEKAKAFWINLYNTYVAYSLGKDPKQFEDRGKFFKSEFMTVAGQELSLDDIEHGIIRHSKNKLSMGYLGKVSVPDFEKKFRLAEVDWHVHFALNCGAKSCPSVAFYDWQKVTEQLDKGADIYLKKTARYDSKANVVYAPMLCSWFRADFGGEDGTRKVMEKHGIVPAGKTPSIKYLDYDWTLFLNNYIEL